MSAYLTQRFPDGVGPQGLARYVATFCLEKSKMGAWNANIYADSLEDARSLAKDLGKLHGCLCWQILPYEDFFQAALRNLIEAKMVQLRPDWLWEEQNAERLREEQA